MRARAWLPTHEISATPIIAQGRKSLHTGDKKNPNKFYRQSHSTPVEIFLPINENMNISSSSHEGERLSAIG